MSAFSGNEQTTVPRNHNLSSAENDYYQSVPFSPSRIMHLMPFSLEFVWG